MSVSSDVKKHYKEVRDSATDNVSDTAESLRKITNNWRGTDSETLQKSTHEESKNRQKEEEMCGTESAVRCGRKKSVDRDKKLCRFK
jgi:hypothetical protein